MRSLKNRLKALGIAPAKYLANLSNKLFRKFRLALKKQRSGNTQPIYSRRAIDVSQRPIWPGQGPLKTNRHFTRARVRTILQDNGLLADYHRFLHQFFNSQRLCALVPELEEPTHFGTLLHY